MAISLVSPGAVSTSQDGLLELTRQVNGNVPEDATVFVHLVDESGQLVGQVDGDPLAGTYPFWLRSPGRAVADYRPLMPDAPAQAVHIGVCRRLTGERLPATSGGGEPWANNSFMLPLSRQRN